MHTTPDARNRIGYSVDSVVDPATLDGQDQILPVDSGPNDSTISPYASLYASHNSSPSRSCPPTSSRSPEPLSKVNYELNSFVVVKHSDATASADRNIYIARIVDVVKNSGRDYADELVVRWYDRTARSKDGRDILEASFQPSFHPKAGVTSQKRRKLSREGTAKHSNSGEPWIDTIHTDTILIAFPDLTKRNMLPLSVQNKIGS